MSTHSFRKVSESGHEMSLTLDAFGYRLDIKRSDGPKVRINLNESDALALSRVLAPTIVAKVLREEEL